jgi:hypothetical protein
MSHPPELLVPRLGRTDRLVALPGIPLSDARHGGRPRLRSTVRVGVRGKVLLIRFDGRDDGIVATYTNRDEPLWREDVFEVFLASRDPPTRYYEFEVNPLGTLFDARVESPDLRRASMRVDPAWDCPGLEARVTRNANRWSALLRIPLEPLAESAAATASCWRANFYRIDRGSPDEYSAWSPTLADPPDFHVPRKFGSLRLPE